MRALAVSSFSGGARPAASFVRALFFFAQLQNQQTVAIVARDGRMFDRAGKLDDFFEPAVGDFELIVRHAFATNTVAAQTADAQERAVDLDLDLSGLNAREIDFHNPAVMRAIHVRRRIPQTPRG